MNAKKRLLYKPPPAEDYSKNFCKLYIVIAISFVFIAGEFIGGYISGSISVISDAFHLVTDLIGFVVSFIFIMISRRQPTEKMSFGYHRMEIIGALGNLFIIWTLAAFIVYQATHRIIQKEFVKEPLAMLIVGVAGLAINIVMYFVLHTGGHSHGLMAQSCDNHGPHDNQTNLSNCTTSFCNELLCDDQDCLKLVNYSHCHIKDPKGDKTVHIHNQKRKLSDDRIQEHKENTIDHFETHQMRITQMRKQIKQNEHELKVKAENSHNHIEQKQHKHGQNCKHDHEPKEKKQHKHSQSCKHQHDRKQHKSSEKHVHGQNGKHDHDKKEESHNGHNHQGHNHQGHNHEAHNHEGHNEEGHNHTHESIGMQAAVLHALSDVIQSIGLLISSLFIFFLGSDKGAHVQQWNDWHYLDPISTYVFSVVVIASTFPIVKNCYLLIMEATPNTQTVRLLKKEFQQSPGVVDVHDLHVWDLRPGKTLLIAHVFAKQGAQREVLTNLTSICRHRKIFHSTLQVEQQNWKNHDEYILCDQDIH